MKKHTFQQGDRVFGQICTGDRKKPGVFVKMDGVKGDGCIIRRDDGVSGVEPGLYWFAEYLTTHDTDFQVGDWVRYEKMDEVGTEALNGKIGVITFVDGYENYPCANVDGIASRLLQANLVKIQPPQEAHVDTVKIKHGKHGVVEGVQAVGPHVWTKEHNGVLYTYLSDKGWSQIHEPEWVTIQVEKKGFERLKQYEHLYGYSDEADTDGECTKWRYPQ